MVRTGMTRRIDELGRLVIPKEIRNNLKIKDNDQVEITVIDNKIILNKYNNIFKDNVIHLIINCLKKGLNKNVLFTNRDLIVDYALVNKEKIDNVELNNQLMNIIENRKDVINFSVNNMLYSIYPLIIKGDLFGSLIIYSNQEIKENEINIIKFSKMFLENYIE